MFNKFKTLASKRLSSGTKDGKSDEKQAEEQSSAELYLQTLKNYAVLMEYKKLQQTAPAGVYLLPSPHSFSTFHGLIFIRKGHYRRAILAFTLTLPPTYPTAPPHIAFTPSPPELYHPLIALHTGALDTAQLHWSPDAQHGLAHALGYVKKAFYRVDWWGEEGGGGRREAREVWRRDKDEFGRRVAECVAWSLNTLVDNGRAMHVTAPSQQHEHVWQRVAQQWKQQEEEQQQQQPSSSTHSLTPTTAATTTSITPLLATPPAASPLSTPAYLSWFMPGPACLLSREDALGDAALGRHKRIVVTADEEREWAEAERARRAEERRRRVEEAAGRDEGAEQETTAEVEAEAEVHAAQYALDESVTPEEEDLP